MPTAEREFIPLGMGVVTVSDTRTEATDKSGALAIERLEDPGHRIVSRRIVTDSVSEIRSVVQALIQDDRVDVIITTGGTGITRRDVTVEAVEPLLTKRIEGFGELFRALSFEEIGASTIQSRALAGLCDATLLFALPGSTGAVRLAMDRIIVPQLDARTRPCNFAELMPRIRG